MADSSVPARTFRRVVILGHTGFIGTHLEQIFRQRSPDLELVGRSAPSLDLTKEEDVRSLAPLFDLDTAVLMLAAVKRQFGDSLETFSHNLNMVLHLCRLLHDRPVGRFVFFSSAAVYGEDIHNTQITEETPVHPTSYYGLAKYTAECLLRKAIEHPQAHHRSLIIVRPALLYGPGDRGGTYGPSGFVRAALNGEPITLWGDGTERREFVFINDVVNLIYQLTFHEYCGVANLVSGKSYTFKEAIHIVSRLMGVELPVTSRPRTKAKVDHGFCNTALLHLLPNVSFADLEEGIRCTLQAESRRTESAGARS